MQLAVISSRPGEGKLFLGGENPSAPLYETLPHLSGKSCINLCFIVQYTKFLRKSGLEGILSFTDSPKNTLWGYCSVWSHWRQP